VICLQQTSRERAAGGSEWTSTVGLVASRLGTVCIDAGKRRSFVCMSCERLHVRTTKPAVASTAEALT
jgi:hypothetical protein